MQSTHMSASCPELPHMTVAPALPPLPPLLPAPPVVPPVLPALPARPPAPLMPLPPLPASPSPPSSSSPQPAKAQLSAITSTPHPNRQRVFISVAPIQVPRSRPVRSGDGRQAEIEYSTTLLMIWSS